MEPGAREPAEGYPTDVPVPVPGADRVVDSAADRFAARARAARRRPLVLALIAVAALVTIGVGAWLVRFSPVLDVRTLEVVGAPADVRSAVEKAAAAPLGTPLAAADLEAVGRRVATVPAVAAAEVSRSWPHTIRVSVTPRVPVLAVAQATGVRLVDASGVAFATAAKAPAGVPVVAAKQTADGRALSGAVAMMAALPPDLRARVSTVEVTSVSAMGFTIGRTTVRWGDASEPQLKVKVLRTLLPTGASVVDVSAPSAPATS